MTERNRRKIRYNSSIQFGVTHLLWRCGEIDIIESADRRQPRFGFSHRNAFDGIQMVDGGRLPVEFFNHELMELDVENDDALATFVKLWGFPYSPLRVDNFCLSGWEFDFDSCTTTETFGPEVPEIRRSIEETDSLRFSHNVNPATFDEVISIDEARWTLRLLQFVSDSIQTAVRENEPLPQHVTRVLNASTCNGYEILWNGKTPEFDTQRLGLTNGVANQIVATIADPADWYECDCVGCERIFKRKHSSSSKPMRDSVYCCDACKNRQGMRNKRAAAKNRIDHGR